MFKLLFSNQTSLLPESNRQKLAGIYPIRLGRSNEKVICIRQGSTLLGYKYVEKSASWLNYWNKTIFNVQSDYPLHRYPWLVADRLLPDNNDVIILRHPEGIRFYQFDMTKSELQLLQEDGNFHDVYDYNMLFGRFYPNNDWVGVMTRNTIGEVRFYAVTQDSFLPDDSDPVFSLNTDLSFSAVWQSASTEFFVTKLRHREPAVIGLRTNTGLEFYQFTSDYLLEKIANTSQIMKPLNGKDRLFFANLTHQDYQDILHLNNSGLYIYQYNNNKQDYIPIHHSAEFTKSNGWQPYYDDSIRLIDLNDDSHHDLVFTGVRGLTALTFDLATVTWQSLINPDQLSPTHRYAKVVDTLPAMPPAILQPLIFTQDTQGNVQWARIVKDINPVPPQGHQTPPITSTKPKDAASFTSQQTLPTSNAAIPEQRARIVLDEKPILRWAELWKDDFLKNSVDITSGQVQFRVPLVDIPIGIGFNVALALTYHSQATSSDLLGIGWSVPLAQDYIFVDYKGSIYPEDANYYLVTQGQPQLLQFIANEGEIRRFQLIQQSTEQLKVIIEYHQTAQRWTITYQAEQAIYGSANQAGATDALQWSLAWPNWRGPGRDPEQLQPSVTAWYLNTRLAKHCTQKLYYHYEKENSTIPSGQTYTSALRLKIITDDEQMRLVFDYASKKDSEYTAPNPFDQQGNIVFPLPLVQSYYLQGYNINTAIYRQTIRFIYETDNQQRLLTAIQQQVLGYNEPVLQFNYQHLLDKQVLQSCILPGGSKVSFRYETVTPPMITIERKNALSFRVGEKRKIVHGSDYTIVAYEVDNKIILRITNRKMTQTIINCLEYEQSWCPSAPSKVQDYALQAYSNLFIILLVSDQNRILYLFNRDERNWSTHPTQYTFSKNALVYFSETLIAAVEPNKRNIMLYDRIDSKSNWKKTTLSVPREITRLVLHHKSVVGYDNHQLWLFYLDPQHRWQSSVLTDHFDTTYQTLTRFSLAADVEQQSLMAFNSQGLQMFNNFISLSSLQENNGQLFLNIDLCLLNAQRNIVQRQSFEILRENILSITYDLKQENSVYKLGYYKEGGYFKIKIKAISGEIVKDIEDIKNRNRKQDEMTAAIQKLNEAPGFQNFFKNNLLINWNRYSTLISQQGVYCGSDILLRFTGTGWRRESQATKTSMHLGKYFILELIGNANNNNQLVKLYSKNPQNNQQGPLLKQLTTLPNRFINRYPAYLAYESTVNSVEVLTFRNEKALGEGHKFNNEQLLLESDLQSLITVANASTNTRIFTAQECLIRPVSSLIPPQSQLYVSEVNLSDADVQRLTGYQHSFTSDQKQLAYSETVTLIPAANKTLHGWYEEKQSYNVKSGNLTRTQNWFDANGQPVFPLKKQSSEQENNETNASSKDSSALLWNRSGQWLISDFSPYRLSDEMGAYYGFESYESNQIGAASTNSSVTAKTWNFDQTQVVKGHFAFTGENYLQLNSSVKNPSFLEGMFEPRDQDTTYLASCWLRCNMPLTLNTAVPYLKAILSTTSGQEIIGLLGQVKQQSGDWFYLELPIDFELIKQIYQDYVTYVAANKNNTSVAELPLPEKTKFRITLRVEATSQQTIDLDHIRFSPLNYDFQATIYQPHTGQISAVIQANGFVTRTIFNRLHQEIGSLQDDGQLQFFSSTSRTGRVAPTPQGALENNIPNHLNFHPENGFYETFDAYALRNRWKLDDQTAWYIAPGQLWHEAQGKHRIEADAGLFDRTNAAIRCYFALQASKASLSFNWEEVGSFQFIYQSNNSTTLVLPDGRSIAPLPFAGELIIMLNQNYVWLWLDGVLLVDQEFTVSRSKTGLYLPWSSFALEAQGNVLLEDCLIMNNPALQIEYFNAFGDKTQVIQLEDAQTAQVTETLYDDLGRGAITTKTTKIHRSINQPLLAYRSNFVINKNPADPQSVWYTGRLQGEVDQLNSADQGIPYSRTKYAPNPLNEEQVLGLPGPDFSITGPYATKLSRDSGIYFLKNLFPSSQGYHQTVEYRPNGSQKVAILDKHNNQVALYTRVPSYNHLLSTYEYDSENRLIKILPPLYHKKVDTASKIKSWQPGEAHLSIQEKEWQKALGTHLSYDNNGNLKRKITPDSGVVEYLYNDAGQMRFMVSLGTTNQTEQIVYFDYDMRGKLTRTGHLNNLLSISALHQYLESQFLPYAQDHQLIDYADSHLDPLLRERIKHYITYNESEEGEDEEVIDEIRFNTQEKVISKSTLSISDQTYTEQFTEFKKEYIGDKVHTLIYPITFNGQPLRVVHHYNRLGQLVKLSAPENDYVSFTYHANGQLASEQYQPHTIYNFTRSYFYNSPGFLERLSDPFLTEEISYTDGYGQRGYGDGIIMQTAFKDSWSASADGRWFQLHDDDLASNYSVTCIKALKRAGYLTTNGQPVKLYIREIETALPLVCGGKLGQKLAQLLAEKQRPHYYGHRYTYGNHQELVKAKYFTEETESLIAPLQPDSFMQKMLPSQSRHIWQLLTNASYIINDQQRNDPDHAIGKRGKSFFRDTDLQADLSALNSDYTLYLKPIKRLIISTISQRQSLSLDIFKSIFLRWQDIDHTSSRLEYNSQQVTAQRIGQMLLDKGYLPTSIDKTTLALDRNFTTILSSYSHVIPEIVKVLSQHFAHALGETAFDVESYEIDANGNHKHFYTGFNRYELIYRNNTNQIQNVKLNWLTDLGSEQVFSINHDAQGNIIQALHKGIQRIDYHPVSHRTTRIQLSDGRIIRFYYDAQGERVLKQVRNAEGRLIYDTYYLRDEQGRVLVDRHTKYLTVSKTIVTAYLYGPKGLLGFIRNDDFYSVTTDHAGSVRLVIKAGQVVAAYDYLPYGQLMRSYGNDPQAHIMYRYTGQEWDDETGLYNYHARLYDPSIGRFYQPDPKSQYFSPYKYAGNSPISLVDPDGEEAFTLITIAIIGAVVGAYIGASAANNRWNPADWDWKDSGTWLGIGGGALAGALLPVGFGASAATIGVGATIGFGVGGGAYLTTAAANQNWNPLAWQWDRPHTWNALFQGFGTGSGIVGGAGAMHKFAGKIFSSVAGKTVFITASYAAGGAIAFGSGVIANEGNFAFWQWDWSNPATWSALVDGFDSGTGWPQGFTEIGRGFSKLAKNPQKFVGLLENMPISKKQALKNILTNPTHPLYKVAASGVMIYFMGSSANGELDITRWNLATFSTYEGVLNGVFFGKDTSAMLKLSRAAKTTQPTNIPVSVNKINRWSTMFHDLLYNVQIFRNKVEYHRLMEQSFSQDRLLLNKLQQVQNQPSSLIRDVENFFKLGLESWKKGASQPPEILKDLIKNQVKQNIQSSSSKAIERQVEAEQISQKHREIFTDRELAFLNCRTARRKKRATPLQCEILKKTTKNDLSKTMTKQFKEDPVAFFQKYAVSTKSTWNKFFKKLKSTGSLKNGAKLDFILQPISPRPTDTGGTKYGEEYHLFPANSINGKSDTGDSIDGEKDIIKGYWLGTSGSGKTVDATATIQIDPYDPEVRYIFTGELQGCSIYAKYDDTTKKMEVFHYNRPASESIYINNYQGSKIVESEKKFVNDGGTSIPEIPDGAVLVNKNNEPIVPKDDVIIIDQELFYKLNGEEKIPIKTIKGTNIDKLIKKNQENLRKEQELAEKYTTVIKWEGYLKFPMNYAFLQSHDKFPHTFSTSFLFGDSNNNWHFVSQKITYKNVASKKPFPLEKGGFHQVPIFIADKSADFRRSDSILPSAGSRLNLRRKKSLNYAKRYRDKLNSADRKGISNTKYLANSVLSNTLSSINQFSVSYKEGLEEPDLNIEDTVSSGSSQVQFWPINIIKRAGSAILSYLPTSWMSTSIPTFDTKPIDNVLQPEPERPSVNNARNASTILEMGDQWVKNIDINGNLMWGILFARKWSSYRPTSPKEDSAISTELNLWATILVDEFMTIILKHALACGIRPIVSKVLKDSASNLKTIQSVRHKLEAGQVKAIPQLLFDQIVKQHISKIASSSTKIQANRLLTRITKDIPKIQQQFVQQNQEWISHKQCLAGITISRPLSNTTRANINSLEKTIPSLQSQQISH